MRIIGFTFVSLTNTMDTHGRQVSSEYRKKRGAHPLFLLQNTYRSLIKTCDKVTNYSVSTGYSGSGGEITLPDKNTVPSIQIVRDDVGSWLKTEPT